MIIYDCSLLTAKSPQSILTTISFCTKPKFLTHQFHDVEDVDAELREHQVGSGRQRQDQESKIVKCRFQDQEDAGTTPEDENSIEGAGGAAATPAAGAAEAAPPACGEEPPAEAAAASAAAAASPSPPEKAGGEGRKVRG